MIKGDRGEVSEPESERLAVVSLTEQKTTSHALHYPQC